MNKKFLLSVIISLSVVGIKAQTEDPVLMKINNRPILKSEFEYLYHKNNTASKQSLDEYIKLFVDYKLKVEEAIAQGLDTTSSFVKEYNNYKRQITQPYLTDTISETTIARKLYDRMAENIETSHILIRLPQGTVLPSDTLVAYQKAMSIRNQLFGKKAKSFETLAKEYSEDPSAQQSDRPGYLGWATSMMFVAPFEDAMYATPVGEVSMPVRSMFGYHLIKVHNRKPDEGKVKVAHIMFSFPQKDATKQEKDSVKRVAENIYKQLLEGANYAELAKTHSSDKMSGANGGSMGWLRVGVGVPTEFMDAAFALQDTGSISKPITTSFGYHIIKLEDKAPKDTWEESKVKIISQLRRSDQFEKVQDLKRKKLAKEIHYKIEKDAYDLLMSLANNYLPSDSIFFEKVKEKQNLQLVSVDDVASNTYSLYTLNNYMNYLSSGPDVRANVSTEFIAKSVDQFILDKLTETYTNILPRKYPEYRNLLKEYHDGILLFNVMNEQVWENAAKDTLGLENHFAKNKAKYTWTEPHYKGHIVYCKDEATMKKAQKLVKKVKKGQDLNTMLKTALNNDSVNFVFARKGVWGKGDNKFVDASVFNGEAPEPVKDYPFFFVTGRMIKAPQEYLDVKGLVISDLQEQREKEWIARLREKFAVEIDDSVLETIK